MSAPFKVQAQAKAKGEKLKANKKGNEGKKKARKAGPASKAKKGGGGADAAIQPAPVAEKIVYEPEAAGEDDHAYFDDDENADYAKFMLSLDVSGLTTFSKKAKDGVAVPPTSKRKAKQQRKAALHSKSEAPLAAPQAPHSSTLAAAVVDDAPPTEATTDTSVTPGTKKDSMVDAKRRKASTTGWVVEDTGPERLPIKTRRGLLKPNERMQQQKQQQQREQQDSDANATKKPNAEEKNGVEAGSSTGEVGEKSAAAGGAGSGWQDTSRQQENGGGTADMMSEDEEESVYDSADNDSELEDYRMGEFDDSGANGISGATAVSSGNKLDLAVLRQRRFEQKKALMGELCESILGAPEESLVRPKTVAKGEDERSRMEQLFALVSFVTAATAAAAVDCIWRYDTYIAVALYGVCEGFR